MTRELVIEKLRAASAAIRVWLGNEERFGIVEILHGDGESWSDGMPDGFAASNIMDAAAALLAQSSPEGVTWQPMETVPTHPLNKWQCGPDVLLRFRPHPGDVHLEAWGGKQMVGHCTPDGWNFAGPTGFGGFNTDSFDGWMPLPAAPSPTTPEAP